MVSFGIGLLGDTPPLETAKIVALAEKLSFDYAWIADESPSYPFRDVFVTLTTCALNTKKIHLGSGVCNPYSRHPSLIAFATSALYELAKGRVALGIGPGGSLSLRPIGAKLWEKPVIAVRDCIVNCKKFFAGESVDFEGELFKIKNSKLPKSPIKVPIYVGARSPIMLFITGKYADGALLTSPLEYIGFAKEKIEEGAKKADKDISRIDIANWLPFAVSKKSEEAKKLVKTEICFMVADSPSIVHEKIGLSIEEVNSIREALSKGLVEAAKLVNEKMIEAFSIAGTPSECIEKIHKLIKAGVDQIILGAPFGKKLEEGLKMAGKSILPSFKRRRA
ncbi:MAG: 5,10-methylenetetrahydromethanopterin reductase [Candidatus Bathyarchaeia archaeon]